MVEENKDFAPIIPKGLEYKLISTNDYSYLQKKEELDEGDEETEKKIRKKNIYMEEGQRMIQSSENKLLTSDVMSSIEKERMRFKLHVIYNCCFYINQVLLLLFLMFFLLLLLLIK